MITDYIGEIIYKKLQKNNKNIFIKKSKKSHNYFGTSLGSTFLNSYDVFSDISNFKTFEEHQKDNEYQKIINRIKLDISTLRKKQSSLVYFLDLYGDKQSHIKLTKKYLKLLQRNKIKLPYKTRKIYLDILGKNHKSEILLLLMEQSNNIFDLEMYSKKENLFQDALKNISIFMKNLSLELRKQNDLEYLKVIQISLYKELNTTKLQEHFDYLEKVLISIESNHNVSLLFFKDSDKFNIAIDCIYDILSSIRHVVSKIDIEKELLLSEEHKTELNSIFKNKMYL